MAHIVYEPSAEWTKERLLHVDKRLRGEEATIPPELARRRANGYFTQNVAMFIIPGEPVLVLGEYPVWRMPAVLRLRGFGIVATVGTIDVDARTGKTLPLSEAEIEAMQNRADEIATRLSPTSEARS